MVPALGSTVSAAAASTDGWLVAAQAPGQWPKNATPAVGHAKSNGRDRARPSSGEQETLSDQILNPGFPDPIPKVCIRSHLNRIVQHALKIHELFGLDDRVEAQPVVRPHRRVIMQKVIELNCEETKAVVGGAAVARAEAVMRRESPLAEFIRLVVRDFENVFGGGQTAKRLAY